MGDLSASVKYGNDDNYQEHENTIQEKEEGNGEGALTHTKPITPWGLYFDVAHVPWREQEFHTMSRKMFFREDENTVTNQTKCIANNGVARRKPLMRMMYHILLVFRVSGPTQPPLSENHRFYMVCFYIPMVAK